MLERLLLVAALAALVLVVWLLLRAGQRRRLHALADARPFAALVPAGRPAIVAFSLPTCVECRVRQAPALGRLRAQLASAAHVTTLSAEDHPALVAQLGILTVPATLVLDTTGAVRFLNQGFADEARLLRQLALL